LVVLLLVPHHWREKPGCVPMPFHTVHMILDQIHLSLRDLMGKYNVQHLRLLPEQLQVQRPPRQQHYYQ
jgi:hypothetical protein